MRADRRPTDRPSRAHRRRRPGLGRVRAQFREWAEQWKHAAEKAAAEIDRDRRGRRGGRCPIVERLREVLAEKAGEGGEPLWIVLIGHGTYDGREAKFNLRGPDVTDLELSQWLDADQAAGRGARLHLGQRPVPQPALGPNRVVVTATKSGDELNFARFGQYLAEAIADPNADLDKDGQVSLLEAFLTASNRVGEYYKTHAQLATEHALLDDNGDRLGTPADWFRGVRATKRAKDGAPLDGLRAHQLHLIPSDREQALPEADRRRRDQLELSLAALARPERPSSARRNTTGSSRRSWSSWPGSIARRKLRPAEATGHSRGTLVTRATDPDASCPVAGADRGDAAFAMRAVVGASTAFSPRQLRYDGGRRGRMRVRAARRFQGANHR